MPAPYHIPALPQEVVHWLRPQPRQVFVDGTCGAGAHAALLGAAIGPDGVLAVIDRDHEALEEARGRLDGLPIEVRYLHGNFADMRALVQGAGIGPVDGVLLDIGVSSHQLDAARRGFSFRHDGPLDLRMDQSEGEPFAEVLARLSEAEIAGILKDYGDERWAARIARFIGDRRSARPIETTGELADLVSGAIPRNAWPTETHPATRTMQAFRVFHNREIEALEQGLDQGVHLLRSGGRLALIAYQSHEHAVAKRVFARLSGRCQCPPGLPECRCEAVQVVRILTRSAVAATENEVQRNRRVRTAGLRVVERV